MSVLSFTVPGRPVGWQRPGPQVGGRRPIPVKTEAYKARVAGAAMLAMSAQGWVRLGKGERAAVEVEIRTDTNGGDIDRVLNSLFDGMTQGGVWDDDRQVRGGECVVASYFARADGIGKADAGVDVVVRRQG